MTDPVKVANGPFKEEVGAGNTYFICSCGKSNNQPYCDGSHKGTGLRPTMFDSVETKTVFFCGCSKSASYPLCDGSHSR